MIDIYVVRKQVMRRGDYDYEARRLRGEATRRYSHIVYSL